MNVYDFNKRIDRVNTASVKWEMLKEVFGTEDVLPMWVADMDFEPPQEVADAIKSRVDHGVYGYTFIRPEAQAAISRWLEGQHGWHTETEWMAYSPGVVPTIATAIQAFTSPGDKVMLQSPVYYPFFDMIGNNGRALVNSQLILKNGRYEIDFDDFEQKLREGVKLFLLCNPHNPAGRVWTKEELFRIGELCLQYDCLILSDEIHSDLVFKPHVHWPIASLREEFSKITITGIAPSKTFNLAGLQASVVVIPDESLRKKFTEQQKKQGTSSLNIFGITAMEAAYTHGRPWLDALLQHLEKNMNDAVSFIKEIPGLNPIPADATYLLWIDCRETGLSEAELKEALLQKGKLGLNMGSAYGPGGEGFVRMNVACSQDVLAEGLQRLQKAFS